VTFLREGKGRIRERKEGRRNGNGGKREEIGYKEGSEEGVRRG
jgi:hypothetical protein